MVPPAIQAFPKIIGAIRAVQKILISVQGILIYLDHRADGGERGLKGAMERCGTALTEIPVDDPGILHDADTPEDYRALLQMHNQQLIRPVVSVALRGIRLRISAAGLS